MNNIEEIIACSDDNIIVPFLNARGLMCDLPDPKPPDDVLELVAGDKKFFIYAFRCCGHSEPKDNGYMMILFPKEHFTAKQFIAAWMELRTAFTSTPVDPDKVTILEGNEN